jgi:hypothetical protein
MLRVPTLGIYGPEDSPEIGAVDKSFCRTYD